MALQPGARLGPYEITGWLGAGGMGEVYRARDPKSAADGMLKGTVLRNGSPSPITASKR